MSYTAVATRSGANTVSSSDWNTYVRDNMAYLYQGRPRTQIIREGSSNYTTSSTGFVAVDTTNLRITQTINSGIYKVEAWGVVQHSDTASGAGTELGGRISLDFLLDGTTRLGGTNGLLSILQSNNGSAMHAFHISGIFTGVTVGSRTIALAWRTSGATAKMFNNAYVIGLIGHEMG